MKNVDHRDLKEFLVDPDLIGTLNVDIPAEELAAYYCTDGILRVIDVLRRSPEPILSYEPIYALHAGRRLTFHRHVADMRSLVFVRPNVSEAEFARLLRESGTVLVEPRFASLLTAGRRRALDAAFEPVFFEPPHAVLVRRDLLPGRKPPG